MSRKQHDMVDEDVPSGSGTHASESHRTLMRMKQGEPPQNTSWVLDGPAPGGPDIPDLIPSFGAHIALDVRKGTEVIFSFSIHFFILYSFLVNQFKFS